MGRAFIILLLSVPAAALTFRTPSRHVVRPGRASSATMEAPKERERLEKEAAQVAARDALKAAEDKLEKLNSVGEAPTSWADLGTPDTLSDQLEVPGFLNWLPGVIGFFAFTTFAANQAGVFGAGPSVEELNAMADSWSNSLSGM